MNRIIKAWAKAEAKKNRYQGPDSVDLEEGKFSQAKKEAPEPKGPEAKGKQETNQKSDA